MRHPCVLVDSRGSMHDLTLTEEDLRTVLNGELIKITGFNESDCDFGDMDIFYDGRYGRPLTCCWEHFVRECQSAIIACPRGVFDEETPASPSVEEGIEPSTEGYERQQDGGVRMEPDEVGEEGPRESADNLESTVG